MRYIFLGVSTMISLFCNGVLFNRYTVFGIHPDLMLAVMVAMMLAEKSMTPAFYMTGGALFLDVLFSGSLGFYMLQYLLLGWIIYGFIERHGVNLLSAPLVGGAAWIVRDVLAFLLSAFRGRTMDLGGRLLTQTLPGALLAAALVTLLYLLYKRLYPKFALYPPAWGEAQDYF